MKKRKDFLPIIVTIIIGVVFFTACSSQNEGRSQIPIYNQLQADGGQFEQARQKMVNIEKTALPDKKIEINAYTTAASLADVQKFYDENLFGWKDLGGSDQNGITIVRWGTGKTKGFAIYYSKGPGGSQNIVLLEQFWK